MASLRDRLRAKGRTVAKRFGLLRIKDAALDRRVVQTPPTHSGGGPLLFLLIALVVTGTAMAPSYTNAIDQAWDSVSAITDRQYLGWVVRGIHYWSAGFMVVGVVYHLFHHLLVGGYKAPREGTWMVGVLLLVLTVTMSFTGYVLRWDERAVYAARVAITMFSYVPLVGDELVLFVQGGAAFGPDTLSRFFAVHVLVVPAALVALAGFHVYLIVVHGVTAPHEEVVPFESAEAQKAVYKAAAQTEELGEEFNPSTVARTGGVGFLVFCAAFAVALLVGPRELMPEANLVETSFPAEEWWFAWYSALAALLPPAVAPAFYVAFPIALLAALVALPLVDRGTNRGARRRPFFVAFVALAALALVGLSALRMRSPWTGWPDPTPPPVPAGVTLAPDAEAGRRLFADLGCTSCHAVAGEGRAVGPDFADLPTPRSVEEMRRFILEPPADVAMPSYAGRVDDADLERLLAFLMAAQTFPRER